MFLLLTPQENPVHLQHLPDAGDNPYLHCIRQIRTSDSRARRRARERGRKTTTIPRIAAGRTASPYDYPPQSLPHSELSPPWTTPRIAHTPLCGVDTALSAHTQRNPACMSKACISSLSGRPLAHIQRYASPLALPTSPRTTAARAGTTLHSAWRTRTPSPRRKPHKPQRVLTRCAPVKHMEMTGHDVPASWRYYPLHADLRAIA
ncbi:hypothetical protein C8R44DRAFT_892394 [Mycena epipterygia]|nr:hypothetical protein C8R44DRAFT_892394 [Mycena epipterygia]